MRYLTTGLAAIALLAIVVFSLQNLGGVEVSFLLWSMTISKCMVIIGAYLLGTICFQFALAAILIGVRLKWTPMLLGEIDRRHRAHQPTRLNHVNQSEHFHAQMAARCSFASSGPSWFSFVISR